MLNPQKAYFFECFQCTVHQIEPGEMHWLLRTSDNQNHIALQRQRILEPIQIEDRITNNRNPIRGNCCKITKKR